MDAGGRAMQELLPRGGIKQFSFAKCFFSISKGKRNKEFILNSPHPTLSSRRGLQSYILILR